MLFGSCFSSSYLEECCFWLAVDSSGIPEVKFVFNNSSGKEQLSTAYMLLVWYFMLCDKEKMGRKDRGRTGREIKDSANKSCSTSRGNKKHENIRCQTVLPCMVYGKEKFWEEINVSLV